MRTLWGRLNRIAGVLGWLLRRTYSLYPRRLPLAIGQNLLGSISEGAAIGLLLAAFRHKPDATGGAGGWLSGALDGLGPEPALIFFLLVLSAGALLTFASERSYVSMSIGLKNALIGDLFSAYWRLGGVLPTPGEGRRSQIRRLVSFATRRVTRAILTLLNGFNAGIRFALFALIALLIAPLLTALVMTAGLLGVAVQYYVARKVHENELRAEAAQRRAAAEMADALRQVDRTTASEAEARAQGRVLLEGDSHQTSDEVFETRLRARVNSELAGQSLFALAMAVAVGFLHFGGSQLTQSLSNASAATVVSAVAYLYVLKVMFTSAKSIMVSLGVVAKFYSASHDVKSMIEAAERPLLVPETAAAGPWPMIVSPGECSLFSALRALRLIEQCGEAGAPVDCADIVMICNGQYGTRGAGATAPGYRVSASDLDRLAALAPAAAGEVIASVRQRVLTANAGAGETAIVLDRRESAWLRALEVAASEGDGAVILAAELVAGEDGLAPLLDRLGPRRRVVLWHRAGEAVDGNLRVARCYLMLDNKLWGRCDGMPDPVLTTRYADALSAEAAEARRRKVAQEADDELFDDELI